METTLENVIKESKTLDQIFAEIARKIENIAFKNLVKDEFVAKTEALLEGYKANNVICDYLINAFRYSTTQYNINVFLKDKPSSKFTMKAFTKVG